MQNLGKSVQFITRQLLGPRAFEEYEAVEKWPEIVGEKLARLTKAEKVVAGRLYVKVPNSTWRNELLMMKDTILEKYSNQFNIRAIRDIIFR